MTQRTGVQTRPGNANKHPGRVITDLARKRRTRAEVAAEREAAARVRAQEEAEQELLIKKIESIQLSLDHHRSDEMVRAF